MNIVFAKDSERPRAVPASVLVTDWDRAPVRLSSRDASRVFGLSVGQR